MVLSSIRIRQDAWNEAINLVEAYQKEILNTHSKKDSEFFYQWEAVYKALSYVMEEMRRAKDGKAIEKQASETV